VGRVNDLNIVDIGAANNENLVAAEKRRNSVSVEQENLGTGVVVDGEVLEQVRLMLSGFERNITLQYDTGIMRVSYG